ncbi:uncharacterized [Tachysurus ichikawai]
MGALWKLLEAQRLANTSRGFGKRYPFRPIRRVQTCAYVQDSVRKVVLANLSDLPTNSRNEEPERRSLSGAGIQNGGWFI